MLLSQEISKNYFVGQRLSEQGGSKSTEKHYIEKERTKTNSGFYDDAADDDDDDDDTDQAVDDAGQLRLNQEVTGCLQGLVQ